jgi:hypothetical protein
MGETFDHRMWDEPSMRTPLAYSPLLPVWRRSGRDRLLRCKLGDGSTVVVQKWYVSAKQVKFRYCWRWTSADGEQSHSSQYFEDEYSAYHSALGFADSYGQNR